MLEIISIPVFGIVNLLNSISHQYQNQKASKRKWTALIKAQKTVLFLIVNMITKGG